MTYSTDIESFEKKEHAELFVERMRLSGMRQVPDDGKPLESNTYVATRERAVMFRAANPRVAKFKRFAVALKEGRMPVEVRDDELRRSQPAPAAISFPPQPAVLMVGNEGAAYEAIGHHEVAAWIRERLHELVAERDQLEKRLHELESLTASYAQVASDLAPASERWGE